MKAMILAAGRGERMRPLTDETPKPLLKVGGKCLLEYHIEALRDAGFTELVINHAYLGQQIIDQFGDGQSHGVQLQYSAEPEGALETGGGIRRALPLLGREPFVVVNGDIWADYPYQQLRHPLSGLAHLVLVDNPPQHPQGDFALQGNRVTEQGDQRLTFSGIGVYHPALFENTPNKPFPLGPLLRSTMTHDQVTGEHYCGRWFDIGTPERLLDLDQVLVYGR